jgi:hypothetical protein
MGVLEGVSLALLPCQYLMKEQHWMSEICLIGTAESEDSIFEKWQHP